MYILFSVLCVVRSISPVAYIPIPGGRSLRPVKNKGEVLLKV